MVIADQLADELHTRLVMPLAGLCGVDLEALLRTRIDEAVDRLVAQLVDDATAERTATDILGALWDGEPDPGWWSTPLGVRCAKALAGSVTDESVTQLRAAEMLGVTRGTVAQLITRGTLDRHPDGGVLLSSVLGRVWARRGHDVR